MALPSDIDRRVLVPGALVTGGLTVAVRTVFGTGSVAWMGLVAGVAVGVAVEDWTDEVATGATVGALGAVAFAVLLFVVGTVRWFVGLDNSTVLFTLQAKSLMLALILVPAFALEGGLGGFVGGRVARRLS